MGYADGNGTLELGLNVPQGTPITVYGMGYRSKVVTAPSQGTATTIQLAYAPKARSALRGEWILEMTLTTADIGGFTPTDSSASGVIAFDSAFYKSGVRVLEEYGRFNVPWTTMLGGPIAPDVSTSYIGPSAGIYEESVGGVFAKDSVYIGLVPRVTHGGLTLLGKVHGDRIEGRWTLNGNYSSAEGGFTMMRRPNRID